MSHSSSGARRRTPDPRLPVRAGRLLRVRAIWLTALLVGSLVVAAMSALYIASAADPLAHGFYRLKPELLAHVDQAVKEYRTEQAAPAPADDTPAGAAPDTPPPPASEAGPGTPRPQG